MATNEKPRSAGGRERGDLQSGQHANDSTSSSIPQRNAAVNATPAIRPCQWEMHISNKTWEVRHEHH